MFKRDRRIMKGYNVIDTTKRVKEIRSSTMNWAERHPYTEFSSMNMYMCSIVKLVPYLEKNAYYRYKVKWEQITDHKQKIASVPAELQGNDVVFIISHLNPLIHDSKYGSHFVDFYQYDAATSVVVDMQDYASVLYKEVLFLPWAKVMPILSNPEV